MPEDYDSVVREIVAAVANMNPADVAPSAKLSTLGLDSLSVMEVFFRCEDYFGRSILSSETPEVHTVHDIVALVGAKTAAL
ncbi:acyl carrier protein [Mycobacterium sp. MUNTM1]